MGDSSGPRAPDLPSDALPNPAVAAALRRRNDLRLLDSLSYLYDVAGSALDEGLTEQRAVLATAAAACQQGEKLRGAAYVLHNELVVAMKAQDRARAHDLLTQAAGRPCVTPTMTVRALGADRADGLSEDALFFATMARENEREYGVAFDAAPPRAEQRAAGSVSTVLERLAELDPDTAAEIDALVTDVLLVSSAYINGGTSFKAFGYLMLRERERTQEWTTYLETLVHEAAHLYLFSLWAVDPLIVSDGGRLYRSPLRREPRPLSGIFHAMFVLARIVRTLRIFRQDPRYRDDMLSMVTSYNNAKNDDTMEQKFQDAYEVVEQHAVLTPLGAALLRGCAELVATA